VSYIFDKIPYFRCKVRREFTTNFKRWKGRYLDGIAVAVRMQRGLSIYFQVWIQNGRGSGAMFLLPIQALVHKPCKMPRTEMIQPWNVFSPDFSCSRIDLFYQSRAYVGPDDKSGSYMMTFDFTGNELADDVEQHKCLHLIAVDDGWFAAVPNNRLRIEDTAFLEASHMRPDFEVLTKEFHSE
jgi:hypothetical protein